MAGHAQDFNSAISLAFKSGDFGGKMLFGALDEIDGVGGLYGGDDSYNRSSNALQVLQIVVELLVAANIKDIKKADLENLNLD